jgi:hypothetical protein
MMTPESTVLEKLFHDDHPMGGRGTGMDLMAADLFTPLVPFGALGCGVVGVWPN